MHLTDAYSHWSPDTKEAVVLCHEKTAVLTRSRECCRQAVTAQPFSLPWCSVENHLLHASTVFLSLFPPRSLYLQAFSKMVACTGQVYPVISLPGEVVLHMEKKSVHREGNVNPVQMESFYHNHTHTVWLFSIFSLASLFTLITDKQEVTSLNEHRCGRDEQRVSLRVCFLFDQVSLFALSGRSGPVVGSHYSFCWCWYLQ